MWKGELIMKIDLNNLSEDFLKKIKDCRVPNMYLANHGRPLDAEQMERMKETAKDIWISTDIDGED